MRWLNVFFNAFVKKKRIDLMITRASCRNVLLMISLIFNVLFELIL